MLEHDLMAYLRANVPAVDGRVHLGSAPQNTKLPVLVVIRISGQTPRTLSNKALFSRANLQVHAVGDDVYAPTMAAANETRELLDGFRGTMGETYIESIRCEGEPSDNSFVDGTKTFRQLTQDFRVVYRA